MSDLRRPHRSAKKPISKLAVTEPADATATSKPTCTGVQPSSVSRSARRTLVQP
jgi:hypothetical protein